MKKIWIVGFGYFGQRAARVLSNQKRTELLAVDVDPERIQRAQSMGIQAVREEGISFLATRLESENPDWIVPALPLHLAFGWLLVRLGKDRSVRRIELPHELDAALPHPFRGLEGDIYVTHATWRCPDDCPEPAGTCTVTQEKRPPDMFRLLDAVQFEPFETLVIRSRQLAPGVGGYTPQALRELYEKAARIACPAIVATACTCHGVVSGLAMEPRDD